MNTKNKGTPLPEVYWIVNPWYNNTRSELVKLSDKLREKEGGQEIMGISKYYKFTKGKGNYGKGALATDSIPIDDITPIADYEQWKEYVENLDRPQDELPDVYWVNNPWPGKSSQKGHESEFITLAKKVDSAANYGQYQYYKFDSEKWVNSTDYKSTGDIPVIEYSVWKELIEKKYDVKKERSIDDITVGDWVCLIDNKLNETGVHVALKRETPYQVEEVDDKCIHKLSGVRDTLMFERFRYATEQEIQQVQKQEPVSEYAQLSDYSINAIKGKKIAIHCPTQEEYEQVVTIMDANHERKMNNKSSGYTSYKEGVCVGVEQYPEYGSRKSYSDCRIIPAHLFIEANKSKEEDGINYYEVGEWIYVIDKRCRVSGELKDGMVLQVTAKEPKILAKSKSYTLSNGATISGRTSGTRKATTSEISKEEKIECRIGEWVVVLDNEEMKKKFPRSVDAIGTIWQIDYTDGNIHLEPGNKHNTNYKRKWLRRATQAEIDSVQKKEEPDTTEWKVNDRVRRIICPGGSISMDDEGTVTAICGVMLSVNWDNGTTERCNINYAEKIPQEQLDSWKVGDVLTEEWLNKQVHYSGHYGDQKSPGGFYNDRKVYEVKDGWALISGTDNIWLAPKTQKMETVYKVGQWVCVLNNKGLSKNAVGSVKQIGEIKMGKLCNKEQEVYNLGGPHCWECVETIRPATEEEIVRATRKKLSFKTQDGHNLYEGDKPVWTRQSGRERLWINKGRDCIVMEGHRDDVEKGIWKLFHNEEEAEKWVIAENKKIEDVKRSIYQIGDEVELFKANGSMGYSHNSGTKSTVTGIKEGLGVHVKCLVDKGIMYKDRWWAYGDIRKVELKQKQCKPIPVTKDNAVVGMKVVRGKDWDLNDTGEGIGTIVDVRGEYCDVDWENEKHDICHRIGAMNLYELYVHQGTQQITNNQSNNQKQNTKQNDTITEKSSKQDSYTSKDSSTYSGTAVNLSTDTSTVRSTDRRTATAVQCTGQPEYAVTGYRSNGKAVSSL